MDLFHFVGVLYEDFQHIPKVNYATCLFIQRKAALVSCNEMNKQPYAELIHVSSQSYTIRKGVDKSHPQGFFLT